MSSDPFWEINFSSYLKAYTVEGSPPPPLLKFKQDNAYRSKQNKKKKIPRCPNPLLKFSLKFALCSFLYHWADTTYALLQLAISL